MRKYIDLHIHSTHSDGLLSVKEIIQESIKNQARYISITDHDIVDGSSELMNYLKNSSKLIGVSGVELTSVYFWNGKKVKIHLLGYNIDLSDSLLENRLWQKRNSRKEQNVKYVKQMLSYCEMNDNKIFTDIDFSKHVYLKKCVLNYYSDKQDISEELLLYMEAHPIKYIEYDFDIEEALFLIHHAGGKAVLAHPYQTKLTPAELDLLVADLTILGLDGIETAYARACDEDNAYAKALAQKYHLLETCGSDFHTYVYCNLIAIGKNDNLRISHCSLLEALNNGK